MNLSKLSEILLMMLSIFSLISDYLEDYQNKCFRFSSFIISIGILTFTFIYSKYLVEQQ